MPRTSQYSRSRRLTMQGVMCLLLVATLGAAALVGRMQRPKIELGQSVQHGQLKWKIPAGWNTSSKTELLGFKWTVIAAEPQPSDEPPRALAVSQQAVGLGTSPKQVMEMTLSGAWKADLPEPFKIGRFEATKWTLRGEQIDDEQAFTLFACVISGTSAISVRLEGFGTITPRDQTLFQQVATSIEVMPSK